ncbi:MAG: hypothetical protein ACRC37_00430, partial [Lentisphaeria bacterium]
MKKMNKTFSMLSALIISSGCTSLTNYEKNAIQSLKSHGISVDRHHSSWEKPASPVAAGALNLLPGFGNFYLASGNASESSHCVYGILNLLFWPISMVWGIPEAAIDADTINQRDFVYYHQFDENGKQILARKNL